MKPLDNEKIDNNLLKLRKKNHLTQDELAKKLHISRQTIVLLEQNKYCPSLVLAYRISNYFGLTIEDIFHYKYL